MGPFLIITGLILIGLLGMFVGIWMEAYLVLSNNQNNLLEEEDSKAGKIKLEYTAHP